MASRVRQVNPVCNALFAGPTSPSTFTFAPGLNLRVIDKGGEPWFVAADVCPALGLNPIHGGVGHHLRSLGADERASLLKAEAGVRANSTIVSESGLYALVLKSRKPEAQRFRKWVTSEVLPAILKTGSYSVVKQAAPAAPVAPQPQAPAQDTMQALAAAVTALNETVRMLLREAHLRSRYAAKAMPPSSTRTVAP